MKTKNFNGDRHSLTQGNGYYSWWSNFSAQYGEENRLFPVFVNAARAG